MLVRRHHLRRPQRRTGSQCAELLQLLHRTKQRWSHRTEFRIHGTWSNGRIVKHHSQLDDVHGVGFGNAVCHGHVKCLDGNKFVFALAFSTRIIHSSFMACFDHPRPQYDVVLWSFGKGLLPVTDYSKRLWGVRVESPDKRRGFSTCIYYLIPAGRCQPQEPYYKVY
jgi:hypothetical protein